MISFVKKVKENYIKKWETEEDKKKVKYMKDDL